MSILKKISTGKRGRAQKVVIYAPEGFGKSTLAGLFPEPLFFDVEDSTSQLDVSRLSREELPTLKVFESALAEVAKTKPCASLVVDTIDWLEQMALDAIIADAESDKIKGVEDFGYGKGYTILKERMTILLARLDTVLNAGVHVVLLAHSKVVKFEPPDGAGPYDRYELKLSKQVAPLIKEWADMLVFGNYRTQVKERDTKKEAGQKFKGVGGKERLMYCTRSAAWDAKNRHSMADVEPWEIGVIEKAFRAVNAPWGSAPAPVAPAIESQKGGDATCAQQNSNSSTGKSSSPLQPIQSEPSTPAETESASDAAASSDPTPAASAAHVAVTTAINEAKDDEIPGIDNPPPAAPEVDAELDRICAPHGDAITSYLRDKKKITPAQTWQHMPAEFAAKIRKNPAAFLKHVEAAGKAVAA